MIRASILVHGKVQGVFFRASAKSKADELGIVGYARNKPDGTVEIVAEGTKKHLEQFLVFCKSGPNLASVTKVDVSFSDATNEFSGFSVE